MAKPRVFISSTFLDMESVRDDLRDYFVNELSWEPVLFEKGGVYYDANRPIDKSCYAQVPTCDLFILLIGGRYGSPDSSEESKNNYVSVTTKEYRAALSHHLTIFTFVKDGVLSEFQTFRKNESRRDSISFAHVDNWRVFTLLKEIYALKQNNPVWQYHTTKDIVQQIKGQMAGIVHQKLVDNRKQASQRYVPINAYKLFYYRDRLGISPNKLCEKTGIPVPRLRALEKFTLAKDGSFDNVAFRKVTSKELKRIEKALDCSGCLAAGSPDDFLSMYIQYHAIYRLRRTKSRGDLPPHLTRERTLFPTRAVVFDFDGTLTLRDGDLTTWERIWTNLGYDLSECAEFHREFSSGHITHREWCEVTCKKFAVKRLREDTLVKIGESLRLVPDTEAVLEELRRRQVSLYIVSGSIKKIITTALGPIVPWFNEISANDFRFDGRTGILSKIVGTEFDFQTKPDFISRVIKRENLHPLEVLFVGNSGNDVWASQSGASTLCVNPHFTDSSVVKHWTYAIRRMESLSAILPYVITRQ